MHTVAGPLRDERGAADGTGSLAGVGWSLVEEVGVDYARGVRHRSELQYPVFAARAEDGTTLVVDELAIQKSVPLRAEYRTLRFGADEKLLESVGEGYGVPAGEDVALLRVTRWELVIDSMTRRPAAVDLSTISKHMPVGASRTSRDTFLVAFADEPFAVDLAEVDEGGRLLWYLPRPLERLGYPGSVQLLQNGNVLVADEFCHVVTELDRDGAVVWELGRWRDPGRSGGRFSSPRSAWETADGERLVADTRNDRVLAVTGAVEVLAPPAGGLSSPTFADRLASGHLLVCDAGNRRVVEYDAQGAVAWACGEPPPRRRLFSFPRAVESMGEGGLLVADTGHDRVVVFENGTCREWPLAGGTELFWPRCARVLASGALLVADGRNGRVLEVTCGGEVVRQLDTLQLEPPLRLSDPHDVSLLPGGNLLITDSPRRLVVEADWNGRVYRAIGGRDDPVALDDPHSAQALPNGDVLICDSGHDRIIRVAHDGRVVSELRAVRCGSSWLRLNRPRHAELSSTGALVVCDTGNNRVLAADESGELLWELSAAQGSPVEWLNQPRWAHLAAAGDLILCDHCHHRILRFRPA